VPAGGIGRAISQRLASAGATVVVTARSVDQSAEFPGTLAETVSLVEQAGGEAIALRAPFILCQQAVAVMRGNGGGWIVNIGSVTAQRPIAPFGYWERLGGATIYAAVKLALNRFTQGLAAELENDNIAVNVVAPSTAISTPGADRFTPEDYPTEPVEYLTETVLAMCRLPARERTGLIAHSLHFPWREKLPVYSLDGKEQLPPPQIPAYAHPDI